MVRGRNGKVLSKIELAKELPHFIHAELVDIGERSPFTMISSKELQLLSLHLHLVPRPRFILSGTLCSTKEISPSCGECGHKLDF